MTVNQTLYPFLHPELSPNDPALPTSPWILPNATSAPDVLTAPSGDELVHPILLGAFVMGVVVMILLLMIVVLRYIAHQKGSYYTHEEALAFKTNPEMQDVPESLEDLEEEEP